MNGIFFNMFRNGDLFIAREFMREIMQKLPMFKWHTAHGNHPSSLIDICSSHLPMPHFHEVCWSVQCEKHEVSDVLPSMYPLRPNEIIRRTPNGTLYINTWAGCFHGSKFPVGNYPNLHELHGIWQSIGQLIYQETRLAVDFEMNIVDYFPSIDYSFFKTQEVELFIQSVNEMKNGKMILACNGPSMSNQSKLTSMDSAIVELAEKNKDTVFVVTSPIETSLSNIYSTKNIFNNMKFDLPQIAYLSTFCDIVIGKNSGPYTYCNTYENVTDKNKIFVCFSNEARDNLLYDVPGTECTFIHSKTESQSDVVAIVDAII